MGDTPVTAATADAVTPAKLDAILDELHEVKRLLHRLTVPVDVVHSAEAARRIGVSVPTLKRLTASGLFTDARSPGRRKPRTPRVYYADELELYRSEGEAGVRRLRAELGRAAPETLRPRRAGRAG